MPYEYGTKKTEDIMNLTTNSLPNLASGPVSTDAAQAGDSNVDSTSYDQMSGTDRERQRARLERKAKTGATRTLPADDPSQWVGKKVRSKKTGTTYVIRQVYKSNRVELEKSWMTYSSDVPAIRADYEICF